MPIMLHYKSDNFLTVTFVTIITLCHQSYANQLQMSEQINCFVAEQLITKVELAVGKSRIVKFSH